MEGRHFSTLKIIEMSFLEQHELANNQDLRIKVKMAVIKAANSVLGDPSRESEFKFCYLIIREPDNNYWLNQIMYSVIANPVITTESTDQDIEFTVNSVFGRHAIAYSI